MLVTGSNRKYKWTDRSPRAIRPRADFHCPLFPLDASHGEFVKLAQLLFSSLFQFSRPLSRYFARCKTNIVWRVVGSFRSGKTDYYNSFFRGKKFNPWKRVRTKCNFVLYISMINDFFFYFFKLKKFLYFW